MLFGVMSFQMEIKKPEPGESLFVFYPGEPIENVPVVHRIGQYIVLENGIKFHFLDDKVGDRTWKNQNHLIQWP